MTIEITNQNKSFISQKYTCDNCGKSFRSFAYFYDHRMRYKKLSYCPNFYCDICRSTFKSALSIKSHRSRKSHQYRVKLKEINAMNKSEKQDKSIDKSNKSMIKHDESLDYISESQFKYKFSRILNKSDTVKFYRKIGTNKKVHIKTISVNDYIKTACGIRFNITTVLDVTDKNQRNNINRLCNNCLLRFGGI